MKLPLYLLSARWCWRSKRIWLNDKSHQRNAIANESLMPCRIRISTGFINSFCGHKVMVIEMGDIAIGMGGYTLDSNGK